jgi:hypothetical protein
MEPGRHWPGLRPSPFGSCPARGAKRHGVFTGSVEGVPSYQRSVARLLRGFPVRRVLPTEKPMHADADHELFRRYADHGSDEAFMELRGNEASPRGVGGRILTLPPHGTGWRRPRRRSKAIPMAMRTSPPRSQSQTGAVSRCARCGSATLTEVRSSGNHRHHGFLLSGGSPPILELLRCFASTGSWIARRRLWLAFYEPRDRTAP